MIYDEIKEVRFLAGTKVGEAMDRAKDLAEKESCIVRFYFNGIKIEVREDTDIKDLVDYYFDLLHKEHD